MIIIKKLMVFLFLVLFSMIYINGQWVRQYSEAGSEYPQVIHSTKDGYIYFFGYTEIDNYLSLIHI